MRKHLLFLVAIGALAAMPSPAAAAPAKQRGDQRCVKRAQFSKLSAAGKAMATTACALRTAAIRSADASLEAARSTSTANSTVAGQAFQTAMTAALALPPGLREAAATAARVVRDAALKAARDTMQAARKTHRRALKAADLAFRTTMEEARAA